MSLGFQIEKDAVYDSVRQQNIETSPIYNVLPSIQPRGSIIYNKLSESSGNMYFSNGIEWVPFGATATLSEIDSGVGITITNPTGPIVTVALSDTTVIPGSYTNANLTVNAQGQLTAAANGPSGGVGDVSAGTGITVQNGAGPIASVGITNTTVIPGSYTNVEITVNQQGQLTFAQNGSLEFDKSYATYQGLGIVASSGVPTTLAPLTAVGPASPNFNPSTGTYTAPADGWYQISAAIVWAAQTTPPVVSSLLMTIIADGHDITQENISNSLNPNAPYTQQVSLNYEMTAGTTIVVQITFNPTGSGIVSAGFLSVVQLN